LPTAAERWNLAIARCCELVAWGEVSMENDSVRTSGDATLVDMWIEGKLRAI